MGVKRGEGITLQQYSEWEGTPTPPPTSKHTYIFILISGGLIGQRSPWKQMCVNIHTYDIVTEWHGHYYASMLDGWTTLENVTTDSGKSLDWFHNVRSSHFWVLSKVAKICHRVVFLPSHSPLSRSFFLFFLPTFLAFLFFFLLSIHSRVNNFFPSQLFFATFLPVFCPSLFTFLQIPFPPSIVLSFLSLGFPFFKLYFLASVTHAFVSCYPFICVISVHHHHATWHHLPFFPLLFNHFYPPLSDRPFPSSIIA